MTLWRGLLNLLPREFDSEVIQERDPQRGGIRMPPSHRIVSPFM